MGALRGYVLEDRAAIERMLAPGWWALLRDAVSPQPMQTPLWLLTWWDVMAADSKRQLRIGVVEKAPGQVVGILPLLRRTIVRTAVIPVETLELLGSGEDEADEIFSEYIGAIVARGEEQPVAAKFAEMLRAGDFGHWDELAMPAMNEDDPWIALFVEALRAQGMTTEVARHLECRYITLPASWDAYVAALDGQNRYFVRRTLRDFEAWAKPLGGAVLKRASNDAELAEGWQHLLEGHSERWEGGGAFRSDKFKRFHEIVTRALFTGSAGGAAGILDLLWLEVGGKPLASLYNIVYDGNVHFYQSGRTVDVPKGVRPGIAVHLYAIQRAIALGYKSYDFLGMPSQYKRQLASSSRWIVNLTAVGPSLRSRISSRARMEARRFANQARGWAKRARAKGAEASTGGDATKAATPAKPASAAKPAGDA